MIRPLVIAIALLWASPALAGLVGDVLATLKHTNCHEHNADCRAEPFNTHCWDPDPWPQRCEQGGKAGFLCDLNPSAPFCQSVPLAGCVGAYLTKHPACQSPSNAVARWEIGFNAIGVRLTDGACAVRKFPSPSPVAYNTTCSSADGIVEVGVHIPPGTVSEICYNFTTSVVGNVTHAIMLNGLVIPGSVISSTGHGTQFCQNFPKVVLETGDILQAGRDLEPFGCGISCSPEGGTCANPAEFCRGIVMGTTIEIL